jgi:hypothetical protein
MSEAMSQCEHTIAGRQLSMLRASWGQEGAKWTLQAGRRNGIVSKRPRRLQQLLFQVEEDFRESFEEIASERLESIASGLRS